MKIENVQLFSNIEFNNINGLFFCYACTYIDEWKYIFSNLSYVWLFVCATFYLSRGYNVNVTLC